MALGRLFEPQFPPLHKETKELPSRVVARITEDEKGEGFTHSEVCCAVPCTN